MLIFSFISWKLAMIVVLLITYLWPFVIPAIIAGVAHDCSEHESWNKTAKGVVLGVGAVIFMIVYLAFLGWISEPNGLPHQARTKLTQSWDAYVAQDQFEEARASITRTDLGVEIKRFKLIAYNPPKHFYVTVQSVEDGWVYQSVYVSKHCNNHRQNEIGSEYNLEVMKYTLSSTPGQVHYEFRNLYQAFCS